MVETINGLFKSEVINTRGLWRGIETVEYSMLERVDRFNDHRLLVPIGNILPEEFEKANYTGQIGVAVEAGLI
jgi:hypothetical protein